MNMEKYLSIFILQVLLSAFSIFVAVVSFYHSTTILLPLLKFTSTNTVVIKTTGNQIF